MTFNILDFIDQLEPDGGTNHPRGDHSFKCPACGAPNFKVNVANGKWGSFGCGAPAPRRASGLFARPVSGQAPAKTGHSTCRPDRLHRGFGQSPPKPAAKPASKKAIRPHQKREWRYDSKEGRPISRSIARTMARGTGRSGNDRWSIDSPLVMFSSSLFLNCNFASLDLQQDAPYVFWLRVNLRRCLKGAGAPCRDQPPRL